MANEKDEILYTTLLKVAISKEQHSEAKRVAKKNGMTLQGWLGQLVIRELAKEQRA